MWYKSVRDGNRRNSVFETELRLTFSPIFRNDAMGLVGSQGTILSTMASISIENVAAWADQGYHGELGVAPSYYGGFVIIVDECFGRSTYAKNVPAQCLNILSLNLTKE
jgi:hypothetical protein